MKITAKTKDIVVTPSMCEGDDTFSIVFRYPTQVDLLKLASIADNGEAITFVNGLFKEFVNKPTLEDEDGKEIDYTSFADLMGYGGEQLTSILADVLQEFQKLGDDAGRLEKKS